MGTSEIAARSVAMPERCKCGHTKARHELAGFDGDCIADGCRCTEFRLVQHDIAQPATPVQRNPAVSGSLNSVEQVVAIARSIGSKRMLLTAARVEHLVAELRALIVAERAAARAEALKVQITAIDDVPAGEGDHPCKHEGCDRTFVSPQAAAMHRRRAHEGFQPQRKSQASTTQPKEPA